MEDNVELAPAIMTAAKGGSGKSTLAKLLASTAHWKGVDIRMADGDPANPTFWRYNKSYFDRHPSAILTSDAPDAIEAWLEEAVFPMSADPGLPVLIDLGANVEGSVLTWLADRGSIVLPRIRAIVPVDCRDALSAAARIVDGIGPARCLLVVNAYGGRNAEAAVRDPLFAELIQSGAKSLNLPLFGRTLHDAHVRSLPPHVMIDDPDPFAAQGALVLLRKIEKLFAPHPDFVPW